MNPRLFRRVASTEARTRMAYRGDFWINAIVTFLGELGMIWFLWTALYRESGRTTIGGYTLDGMVIYAIVVVLVAKLVRGAEWGGGVISGEIYDGSLSRYLVYPASYLGFKYAQQLGSLLPALLQLVLFGVATVVVFPVPPEVRITPISLAMGLSATLVANALYYLLAWPVQSVAFWADNVWSLTVAMRLVTNLLGGAMFPLTILPGAVQDVLAWAPFRYLFAFPTEALLGRLSFGAWAGGMALGIGWCFVFYATGRWVWTRGQLRYTGVGM